MNDVLAADRIESFQHRFRGAQEQIRRIIVGNDDVVQGIITCLLARGHGLLEGIPGVGKTRLVQACADALHLKFARIQFTPDLMPGDILGGNVLHEKETGGRELRFQPGPIFANLILADEINRATPKTQSALLEAMQENSVTIGTTTHVLEQPVCVLATQNPIELEGTYPLPEAQLDRFFFKLRMGFPGIEALHDIIDRTTLAEEPAVARVLDQGEVLDMRQTARNIPIARPVQDYAIRMALATRPEAAQAHPMVKRFVRYGASPRGAQALVLGAKVHALMSDRVHVAGADIRAVALPALRHRIMLNYEGQAEEVDPDTLIDAIIESLPDPK
ncbi:MAG TPA: MoxR family ATPase [Lautropia sp.]|jgi:MoxR-like ATPase|nr:MoxR family ATPase [Lautropia sp.]